MDSKRSTAHRSSRRASQESLPPCVQAVIMLGYPKNTALSAYQQLSAGSFSSSANQGAAGAGGGAGAEAGATATPNPTVTAALLMSTLDTILAQSPVSGGDDDGSRAASQDSLLFSDPVMGARREDHDENEDGPGDRSEEAAPPSSPTSVSQAPPTPVSDATPPPNTSSTPHVSDRTSSTHSAPALPGADPQSPSCPAEERAREKRRLLTRLRALREENRRLIARQVCGQCRQRPVELTFLPCGHFVYCQTCGSAFETCPVCRKTILADVRTFLS